VEKATFSMAIMLSDEVEMDYNTLTPDIVIAETHSKMTYGRVCLLFIAVAVVASAGFIS
jgi:hypothetical protein